MRIQELHGGREDAPELFRAKDAAAAAVEEEEEDGKQSAAKETAASRLARIEALKDATECEESKSFGGRKVQHF